VGRHRSAECRDDKAIRGDDFDAGCKLSVPWQLRERAIDPHACRPPSLSFAHAIVQCNLIGRRALRGSASRL